MINTSIFILIFVVQLTWSLSDVVTVQTRYGPVEGEVNHSYDQRYGANITYTSFVTIPFAAPPVGDLRFSPPVPPEPWAEPRNRSDLYWRVCYQVGFSNRVCNFEAVWLGWWVHIRFWGRLSLLECSCSPDFINIRTSSSYGLAHRRRLSRRGRDMVWSKKLDDPWDHFGNSQLPCWSIWLPNSRE